ncbi:MAG: sigma factor [Fusobacteriaceae bacterium]
MRLREYEILVIEELKEDEGFQEFLEKNIVELEENLKDHLFSNNKEFKNIETSTLEYLEEISIVSILSEEETEKIFEIDGIEERDEIITKKLYLPIRMGMFQLKDGIDYMDLTQEGTIALIKAVGEYKNSGYKDFDTYAKLYIVRAMVLFIYNRMEEIKSEYIVYFENKKNEYMDSLDIVEGFEKRIQEIGDITYLSLKNSLTTKEIEVLVRYYGLNSKKSLSIYELEETLKLEKGTGEKLFQIAINKLSRFGGEMIKL